MPVMSGLDCLRELNKRQSISSINVLVLTMHNEQQYIKEVMLLGAKGYLRKDTLDTELFKALRTLLIVLVHFLLYKLINIVPILIEILK